MKNDILKIYLDCDGVIADFDIRAIETFGHRFDEFPTSKDAWEAMKAYQHFYRDLPKMPDADELVNGVYTLAAQHGYSVGVLTALPRMQAFPFCEEDKKLWLNDHWPQLLHDFNIGPYAVDKQKWAKPGQVLIDDRPMNIEQWRSKGGYGILHVSAKQSLGQLRKYLKGGI